MIVYATLQVHVYIRGWFIVLLRIAGSRSALTTPALSVLMLGIFRHGLGAQAFSTERQVAWVD
jgi:hypothetical protein